MFIHSLEVFSSHFTVTFSLCTSKRRKRRRRKKVFLFFCLTCTRWRLDSPLERNTVFLGEKRGKITLSSRNAMLKFWDYIIWHNTRILNSIIIDCVLCVVILLVYKAKESSKVCCKIGARLLRGGQITVQNSSITFSEDYQRMCP